MRMPMKNGKPAKDLSDEELHFMDMPGRRSHEYFPQFSVDGKYLVWGITQRGHDHDIADYEIYLWEVGEPPEKAARLTFHSGNDRWPDIFIPAAVAEKQSDSDKTDKTDSADKDSADKADDDKHGSKKESVAEAASSDDKVAADEPSAPEPKKVKAKKGKGKTGKAVTRKGRKKT
jgi:hypothetical protein